MGPVATLARATIRAHRLSLAGLAVLVALGLGVSLAAFAIAARTDRAYDQYLDRANVGDLVVNPSLNTARAAEIIADTPGVSNVTSDDLLTVTFDDGAPRAQAEVDSVLYQVRVSDDGRYRDQDRPVITKGRNLRGGAEAVVSKETADELDIELGERLPLAFWFPSYNQSGISAAPDEIVEPLGHTDVIVVGIAIFSDEVLSDPLYPRLRVILTPEVAEKYTCVYGDPRRDAESLEELYKIIPRDCSMSYRFFSMNVDGGATGARAVADEMIATFNEENEQLPEELREQDVGYFVIPTFLQDQRTAVNRAISPTVTALRLFGLAAGAATIVLALLAAFRIGRRSRLEALVWRQLGVERGTRVGALAAALLLPVAIGVLLSFVIAWLASALGPIGTAAVLESGTHFSIPADVALLVGGTATALLLLGGLVVAATSGRASDDRTRRKRSVVADATRNLRPTRALGIQAATTSSSAGVVALGGVVAVSVVVAAALFSANLTTLMNEPTRYGWPYDAAVIIGFGYGGGDDAAISAALDRPEVETYGLAGLPTVAIDGHTVAAIAARAGFDTLNTPLLHGRYPTDDHEIAVGTHTLSDLDAEIGDTVAVSSYYGDRDATITGVVVLPAVGAFESNRAESGRGVLLSKAFMDASSAEAEKANGLPPGSFEAAGPTALVGIDLADGVDPEELFAELGDAAWDRNDFETVLLPAAVRPSALEEASTLRRVPTVLGVLLALAMAVGLALGVSVATRARQREIAILRALGSSVRDVRGSVLWHAMTVVGVAVLVGIPLGVIAGRLATREFLEDLGVSADVVVPIATLVGVAVVAGVTGLLAAIGPSRAAARGGVDSLGRG